MLPGACIHQDSSGDLDTMARVLEAAVGVLGESEVPYVVVGGIASSLLGRPRCSSDLDLFVAPEHAPKALQALGRAGFRTERTNPHWLYKAVRGGVLVDLLFKSKGDIYLDAEMQRRASLRRWRGVDVRVVPAEDLVVMKAIAHDEETPRHWSDALGILARCGAELDAEYLRRRARCAPRRVLSLLLYATSIDLIVPRRALRGLAHDVLHG